MWCRILNATNSFMLYNWRQAGYYYRHLMHPMWRCEFYILHLFFLLCSKREMIEKIINPKQLWMGYSPWLCQWMKVQWGCWRQVHSHVLSSWNLDHTSLLNREYGICFFQHFKLNSKRIAKWFHSFWGLPMFSIKLL